MPRPSIFVAGDPVDLDSALRTIENYPAKTPGIYDYPGPGEPSVITVGEIGRTRAVSSRISRAEGAWFIQLAESAPWTPVDTDLQAADPAESAGLYDMMLALYDHFSAAAPRGVGRAKISKVLHLKRPTQFPILDSRLARTYRGAATRAALAYPGRGNSRMYWAAIRSDVIRSADGLAALRTKVGSHESQRVRALQAVTDLRLLDMLTW